MIYSHNHCPGCGCATPQHNLATPRHSRACSACLSQASEDHLRHVQAVRDRASKLFLYTVGAFLFAFAWCLVCAAEAPR